jgi:hypothetical protein
MATWADLEKEAPEIAEAGSRLLPEVAFLATVSTDGRPRVHPVCPVVTRGRLWAFVMEESPKRRDLDSNGNFAIHALPGPEDEEFYVAGHASRVLEPGLVETVSAAMPYDDADERHFLYEFFLARALWTTWENFQKPGMRPIHRVWRASDRNARSPRKL